jgi:hypothetical protein
MRWYVFFAILPKCRAVSLRAPGKRIKAFALAARRHGKIWQRLRCSPLVGSHANCGALPANAAGIAVYDRFKPSSAM